MTTPPVLPERPRLPTPPPPPGTPHYPQSGYRPPAQPAPPAVSPAGAPLASFVDRLVAYFIDGLILGAVGSVVLIPLYLVAFFWVFADIRSAGAFGSEPRGGLAAVPFGVVLSLFALMAVMVLLLMVLSYVYHVELMFRTGQTIGKRVMKIRVVPVDPRLPLNRALAAKRFLVTAGSGLVPGLALLDGLWQLWDKPYQQCLHDKWPSTLVIKLNT